MESTTKERLTGALILVAALVILVPEMLSGPGGASHEAAAPAQDPAAGAPLRTYDMVLDAAGGSKPAPQDSLTPAQQADAAAVPPPVAQVPPAALVPPQPQPDSPVPATSPTPAQTAAAPAPRLDQGPAAAPATPEAKPAVTASSGQWWVQVGVFASRENAERLARELGSAGMPTQVASIRSQGKELQRVRAGPVADRAAAAALQGRLAAKGHKSSLVAP